jgi:O-methyltransferase
VSEAEVRANFERYGLLDEQVQFVAGWFKDTMPALAGRRWSLIRLDGDMYGSTMEALTALYPGLAKDGFLIVDDYGEVASARRAVDDFRRAHGIEEPLQTVDSSGVYWRRAS